MAHLRAERYLGDDLAETNAYDHLLERKVERKVAEESMQQLHKANVLSRLDSWVLSNQKLARESRTEPRVALGWYAP